MLKLILVVFLMTGLSACAGTMPQGKLSQYHIQKFENVVKVADNERQSLPTLKNIEEVNKYVNSVKYVSDNVDTWKAPLDFFKNGGDCEDYAIAKYEMIQKLGINENKLKIAIVLDKKKRLYHAILLVDNGTTTMVLDNQNSEIESLDSVNHRYKLIYATNKSETVVY